MKTFKYIALGIAAAALAGACTNLSMNPLDKPSNETWYQTQDQIEMALNTMLLQQFWPEERTEFVSGKALADLDEATDDAFNRNSQNSFKNGSLSSSNNTTLQQMWSFTYKGISRCNSILENIHKAEHNMTPELYDAYVGCARFYRACFYARIMERWGDPIYFTKDLDLTEAFKVGRTSWEEALEWVYDDFDAAIADCPLDWTGSVERVTRGAAYAMKARTALYFASIYKWGLLDNEKAERHFGIARDCAWECMKLGVYSLHPDFGELFLSKTQHAQESIFCLPRSVEYAAGNDKQYLWGLSIQAYQPRCHGVGCSNNPTWDLFCAFLCDDGKTIDKSPRYNPQKPFENRDPRLAETMVEFGTNFCGIVYDPYFGTSKVWSEAAGGEIDNADNIYIVPDPKLPARNGLVRKKGIDEDWFDDYQATNDKIIIRYADVLLIYAEAKIELNEIDDSVLEAMNRVRARAYKVDYTETDKYPAITARAQDALRTILRTERRMEFAFERKRLADIVRWRIAETVLNYSEWGFPYNNKTTLKKIMDDGKWFIPATPTFDESGCPDLDKVMTGNSYAQKIWSRVFDPDKHYLWPIPSNDELVNANIGNNPGY